MSAERTAEELRAEIARHRRHAILLRQDANAPRPWGLPKPERRRVLLTSANRSDEFADRLSRQLRTLEAERGER